MMATQFLYNVAEDKESDWTVRTVLKHLKMQLVEMDRRYSERFVAQEKAISVAEDNAEKWRASSNEWRNAMNDRERSFARREQIDELNARIEAITDRQNVHEGEASGSKARSDNGRSNIAIIIAVITLIISLLLPFIIPH